MPVTRFRYRLEPASSARWRSMVIPVAPPPTMLLIIAQFLVRGVGPDARRGGAWRPLLQSGEYRNRVECCRPGPVEPDRMAAQAARTLLRKFSTSALRLPLSFDSERADASTCAEAEPVALAPWLTRVIFSATSAVPLAASPTLRAISAVAAPCSSTVAAMVDAISEMWVMVAPISLIATTESCVAIKE